MAAELDEEREKRELAELSEVYERWIATPPGPEQDLLFGDVFERSISFLEK
jgi:hypothetical protein